MTVMGLPWWFALALVAAGIAIGNLVVPYIDNGPRVTDDPIPSRWCREAGETNALLEEYPLCP